MVKQQHVVPIKQSLDVTVSLSCGFLHEKKVLSIISCDAWNPQQRQLSSFQTRKPKQSARRPVVSMRV